MVVEDQTKPADMRFFHVLQAADPGSQNIPVSMLAGTCSTGMCSDQVSNESVGSQPWTTPKRVALV
jgi:hypothetical protein